MLDLLKRILFVPTKGTPMADPTTPPDTAFFDKYIADVATDSGVSPTIIQEIIAFLMTLLGGFCPTPVPAQLTTPSNIRTIRMMQAMDQVGEHPRSSQGRKILAAMQTRADALAPTDAATFISMCQKQ